MKKLLTAILIIAAGAVSASACEFSYTTDKSVYSVGETASVKIIINNDHRRCPIEGELPQVFVKNVTSESKSDFVESSPGTWEITYKFKITSNDAAVKFVRKCDKGGFDKIVTFDVK